MRKSGRPTKKEHPAENEEKILAAAIALTEECGAESVTVRSVCERADIATGTFYYHFKNKDELMMRFVQSTDFDDIHFDAPSDDISGRIIELYIRLIRQYTRLGPRFMRSFYTANNQALRNYMGETDGKFAAGTVMARCEAELARAEASGQIENGVDIHQRTADICTVIKGCIFEWCLSGGTLDIERAVRRILTRYLGGRG